jgi:hypothetical protein
MSQISIHNVVAIESNYHNLKTRDRGTIHMKIRTENEGDVELVLFVNGRDLVLKLMYGE